MKHKKVPQFVEADDLKESTGFLLRLRLPWLMAGLVGGFLATFLISRFEAQLAQNVKLAFFMPMIIYLSDAVGTQTETIYVRNITDKKAMFKIYLAKEIIIGTTLGVLFGLIVAAVSFVWLRELELALTVGLSMALTVAFAPIVALCVAKLFQIEHHDPAVGAGPFTTVLQDIVSILIYFAIASIIMFH